MTFDFSNMFSGMFQPITGSSCRMGINGEIAVKTSTGYKTYNVKTGKLTNCTNFAFDVPNMFWVVPTMHVSKGDIILVNGQPKCVIDTGENSIRAFSYENSTIEEVVPEYHVYMGKTYCYGKVFSPFSSIGKNNNSMSSMMKMMMLSQMFGNGSSSNGMNPMMLLLMGKGGFDDMFEGAFDFGTDGEGEEKEAEE